MLMVMLSCMKGLGAISEKHMSAAGKHHKSEPKPPTAPFLANGLVNICVLFFVFLNDAR